jgi:anti-sigma factor ChrR (cupin superfamily)
MSDFTELRKGIMRKHLASDPERKIQMDILKISPGLNDPPHWHDDWEWVYVLEGSLEDEKGVHNKGDFFINGKDARHQPRSEKGCTLLIVWCGSVRHTP